MLDPGTLDPAFPRRILLGPEEYRSECPLGSLLLGISGAFAGWRANDQLAVKFALGGIFLSITVWLLLPGWFSVDVRQSLEGIGDGLFDPTKWQPR